MAFCRQADWGLVDTALYSEAFIMRCSFCLSDTHISVECPYAPVEVKTPEARSPSEEKMGRPPIRKSTQGPAGHMFAVWSRGQKKNEKVLTPVTAMTLWIIQFCG